MGTMAPLPKDHPLLKAWEQHRETEEFKNSRNWAVYEQHLDGSLWAMFMQGWIAAGGKI